MAHKSIWQEFLDFLKQKVHLRPHEINVAGHDNSKTAAQINAVVGGAIDAIPPGAVTGPLANALKIHPDQLKGTNIPTEAHALVADAANAAVAAKLANESVTATAIGGHEIEGTQAPE